MPDESVQEENRMKIRTGVLIPAIFLFTATVFPQVWMTYNQDNSALPSNKVQCICIDGDGNKWFGTDNGLTRFNGTDWTIYQMTEDQQTLASDNIRDIDYELTEDGPQLWLATDNGVSVVGIRMDGLTMATPYRTDNTELPSNSVYSAAVDSQHRRWFGTEGGVALFDGNENEWQRFTAPDDLPHNHVVDIGIDNAGGWRYCCTQGEGVGRLRVEVDGITSASPYDTDWSGMRSNFVNAVYIYEDGDQWFGTPEGASFHDTTLTKERWEVFTGNNGLPSNDVHAITVDQDDRVWFGTSAGVAVYNWNNFSFYSTADGLASNNILDVAVDNDSSLWFGTDNGVTHARIVAADPDVRDAHDFTLLPNYPNPFHPSTPTTLSFKLSRDAHVRADIMNVQGQHIRRLIDEYRHAGLNDMVWNGMTDQGIRASTGVYVVRMHARSCLFETRKSQKILMVK